MLHTHDTILVAQLEVECLNRIIEYVLTVVSRCFFQLDYADTENV
jgi:hypothetical protein